MQWFTGDCSPSRTRHYLTTPPTKIKRTCPCMPPWAWCEVLWITPRCWLCPSWVLQKLALSWPGSDQVSPPGLRSWWHYCPNRVSNQKSTTCVEAMQSCGYGPFIPSQLLFNLLFLYSDLCQHLNQSHILVEQECMVLFTVFSWECFNIFIMMLWYSLQSSNFHHSS